MLMQGFVFAWAALNLQYRCVCHLYGYYILQVTSHSQGLCRLNRASECFKSGQSRGNGVSHETQFGIIRKAALYAGHGPATVKLFWDLWNKKQ
jgi:hypothetical protein